MIGLSSGRSMMAAMAAAAALSLGGGVVHGEAFTPRRQEPTECQQHPTKGPRGLSKQKGKAAKVRHVPLRCRNQKKIEARKASAENYRRIQIEGIDPKYMHAHARRRHLALMAG